jgi:hypothetical protein
LVRAPLCRPGTLPFLIGLSRSTLGLLSSFIRPVLCGTTVFLRPIRTPAGLVGTLQGKTPVCLGRVRPAFCRPSVGVCLVRTPLSRLSTLSERLDQRDAPPQALMQGNNLAVFCIAQRL